MNWTRLVIIAFGAALFACDDDGGSSGTSTSAVDDPATVTGGKNTAENSAQLTALGDGVDMNAAQGPISAIGGSMQQWVGSFQAYNVQQMQAGLTSSSHAQGVNEVSYENNHLSANITYSGNGADIHYAVELDIVPSDPGHTIDGTFDMDFAIMQIYEIDITYNGVYSALKLDGMGCPTSGSIALDYAYEVKNLPANVPAEAAGQIEQSGSLVATYGPNCGDVAVEGAN